MTLAHAHPGLATKVLYFALWATVFIFLSMFVVDRSSSLKAVTAL
jgi:hypothetical protein